MLTLIPYELRALNQWVIAANDKVPYDPKNPSQKADVTRRETWGSYEQAVNARWPHVGFVLSREDPYCIIDLDNPLTESQAARHRGIVKAFQSYSEYSQSRKGLHIICRGSVPRGTHYDKVEVYSERKYMICTGNVHRELPIVDMQSSLTKLYHEIDRQQVKDLEEKKAILSDDQVIEMASHAKNSENFDRLWTAGAGEFLGAKGEWYGNKFYPSHSDADLALFSMLCYYSQSNEQVIRLFRKSALGIRPKAERMDYLERTLRRARSTEIPYQHISFTDPLEINKTHEKETQQETHQKNQPQKGSKENDSHAISRIENGAIRAGKSEMEGEDSDEDSSIDEPEEKVNASRTNAFPPGFIGETADFVYSASVRPVREIALAAAIGLTAGISGRSFNISGSGLNQYLILLAKTGSGKEGIGKGIDILLDSIPKTGFTDNHDAHLFIGPSAFASGQALVRILDKQPCFLSVLGEFGFTLQALSDPRANPAQVSLKKVLLDIYAKSGHNSFLAPSVYSDSEKNTKRVRAPNLTILGESTPEIFYEKLDASSVAQGLIPRFSLFEYDGPRPARNRNAFCQPSQDLSEKLGALISTSLSSHQTGAHCPVTMDSSALRMMDEFDEYATEEINKASGDIVVQLWNRAHLKALKLGALAAVGCNWIQPVMTKELAAWAIQLVCFDVRQLIRKFSDGDIGSGDTKMESDVRRAINDFLRMSQKQKIEYQTHEKIVDKPIVPLTFLRRRLRNLTSFKNDRRGSNAALAAILKSMCDAEEIELLSKKQVADKWGIKADLYTKGTEWGR